ncbi:uncharacterized protein MYCFIDRAFT_175944 [Pseudocercospora fijiensis CIRAD86]|uniref:Uncharacterized protein n=1 Tax=Pseudocercospora fijiensis (strain CIRAD86) TaxID=383855 RepID=M3ACX3_PSEFD|nr:uncharacterized protein MYCFIDRAFT_175944 [Pseudocercospora fijiensis CIRAD86]EME82401.1 hypothetical protein MYCFIDRAFT_175944 [Pseudocercospora fijiensis CIRAD86]
MTGVVNSAPERVVSFTNGFGSRLANTMPLFSLPNLSWYRPAAPVVIVVVKSMRRDEARYTAPAHRPPAHATHLTFPGRSDVAHTRRDGARSGDTGPEVL